VAAPRVIDAPAFPAWDVTCPARDEATARKAADGLRGHPLVAQAEVGSGALVSIRWSAAALVRIALERVAQGEAPSSAPPCPRACRRAEDYVRMARHEHGEAVTDSLPCDPEDMHSVLSLLDAAANAGNASARARLLQEGARRFEALYTREPLLRGSPAQIAGRTLAARAVMATLRWAAAQPPPRNLRREGFSRGQQEGR